jgi:hypothetical protein
MLLLPSWGVLIDGIPWGFGSHGVGSSTLPCSLCGKTSHTRNGRQVYNWFGLDDGENYRLCGRCVGPAWEEAARGLVST